MVLVPSDQQNGCSYHSHPDSQSNRNDLHYGQTLRRNRFAPRIPDDKLVSLDALNAVVGRNAVNTKRRTFLGSDSGVVVVAHHSHAPFVVGVEHPKVRLVASQTVSVLVAGQTVVGTVGAGRPGLLLETLINAGVIFCQVGAVVAGSADRRG